MIPTPSLTHLKAADYEHVYEPAEDTFALLDALEQDAAELKERKPLVCLEIGSALACCSSDTTFTDKRLIDLDLAAFLPLLLPS